MGNNKREMEYMQNGVAVSDFAEMQSFSVSGSTKEFLDTWTNDNLAECVSFGEPVDLVLEQCTIKVDYPSLKDDKGNIIYDIIKDDKGNIINKTPRKDYDKEKIIKIYNINCDSSIDMLTLNAKTLMYLLKQVDNKEIEKIFPKLEIKLNNGKTLQSRSRRVRWDLIPCLEKSKIVILAYRQINEQGQEQYIIVGEKEKQVKIYFLDNTIKTLNIGTI